MRSIKITLILTIIALLLAACGGNQASQQPTVSVSDVQTMAVSVFAAGLTQTAEAMPTSTPAPTDTPMPTNTILSFDTLAPLSANGTPVVTAPLTSPTASCYNLSFVSETIPDGTKMKPGEKFTKTWTVQNTGSCAWDAGFKFTWKSGNPMGGSTQTLNSSVAAGSQEKISVAMIAPTGAGEYKGTWQMQDANNTFFGDAIWVDVVVAGAAADTATPTP